MAKKNPPKPKKTASKWKSGIFKRIWKIVKILIIVFFSSSIFFTVLFKWVNPPLTPLMVIRLFDQMGEGKELKMSKDWVSLDEISKNMPIAVMASEDNNFLKHNGIDMKAIKRAKELNKKRKNKLGASTISQQTAKNVFLTPSRTYIRKGFELYFTGLIELIWGKERIMEVYLNVIEMGDGIYGVEAASQAYFHKSAKKLSKSEAATIAATLPNPRRWNAGKPTSYIQKRKVAIMRQMNNVRRPKWD